MLQKNIAMSKNQKTKENYEYVCNLSWLKRM